MADRSFVAACVQMRTGRTVARNVEVAAELIGKAADEGAQYVQTPEMTNILVRSRDELFAAILPEDVDPSLAAFQELARGRGIWLHIGSLAVRLEGNRAANRSFVIGPDGEIAARYDKIHMFDVDLPDGETWRESETYRPGEQAVTAQLPWGRLGLTICYDVRFPTLHRALAENGAEVLASPAAFTRKTGEAHWHVLLRARAVETGSFVVAAAQGGKHEDGRETFGHSLIVDPWGRVLAEGGEEPGIVMAKIDLEQAPEMRRRIPALENGRRFGVVPLPTAPTALHEAAPDHVMIRYGLRCDAGHGFDAWFRSSSDFDAQAGRGLLSCPSCGSASVAKALMAPAISSSRKEAETAATEPNPVETSADAGPVALLSEKEQKLRGMLREIRQQLTANSENVGERFPEVARQMHAEEIEQRSIHGKATAEEAKALAEEGIAVHPLPSFPDERD